MTVHPAMVADTGTTGHTVKAPRVGTTAPTVMAGEGLPSTPLSEPASRSGRAFARHDCDGLGHRAVGMIQPTGAIPT